MQKKETPQRVIPSTSSFSLPESHSVNVPSQRKDASKFLKPRLSRSSSSNGHSSARVGHNSSSHSNNSSLHTNSTSHSSHSSYPESISGYSSTSSVSIKSGKIVLNLLYPLPPPSPPSAVKWDKGIYRSQHNEDSLVCLSLGLWSYSSVDLYAFKETMLEKVKYE